MAKTPAMNFYAADWLRDPDLKMATFGTKGIWIDMLCHMWFANPQGKLKGTPDEICRLVGCGKLELSQFLDENKRLKFCNVQICNGIVTLINRRMYAAWKDKELTRQRVRKHRKKEDETEL